MRNLIAAAAATALLTTGALAADDGSLAAGKPAGLKQAQYEGDNTVLYIIGVGVLAAGIAIAASSGGNSNNGQTGGNGGATTATS